MQSLVLFMDWWLGQLSSLLPAALVERTALSPAAVIVEHENENLNLLVRRGGHEQPLARSQVGEAGVRALSKTLREQGGPPRLLLIRLPAGAVLRKTLTLPTGARRNIAEVLGFEIDLETPFRRDEVHWTYVVRGHNEQAGQFDVELVLLPRSHVDPLADLLRACGLAPAGIETDTGPGGRTLIPLYAGKGHERLDARVGGLAAAAVILALLAIATPFGIQLWELAAIEARIAALESPAREAADLRRDVGRAAAAADFLSKARGDKGSALAALAAVTRSLPDDSYLGALSLRSGRITLNGFSPSAAQLIRILADSQEFREPAFEAPVTRDPESELETFTISVPLAPASTR